jgi:hypothetical protein
MTGDDGHRFVSSPMQGITYCRYVARIRFFEVTRMNLEPSLSVRSTAVRESKKVKRLRSFLPRLRRRGRGRAGTRARGPEVSGPKAGGFSAQTPAPGNATAARGPAAPGHCDSGRFVAG